MTEDEFQKQTMLLNAYQRFSSALVEMQRLRLTAALMRYEDVAKKTELVIDALNDALRFAEGRGGQ